MLEVLVAIVIITVGLLGVAALQLTGIKNNHSAMSRSQALVMAYDLLDRMRVNRKQTKDGKYDTAAAFVSTTPGGASGMAKTDLDDWLQTLGKRLPSSKARVDAAAKATIIRVTIQWDDSRGTGGGTSLRLSVESQGCGDDPDNACVL